MSESRFEARVVKKIKELFPGCLVIKLDAGYLQGITDRLILWGDRWATLEFKDSEFSPTQPNQRYYVELMDEMSFSAFIYPENEEEVLRELQLAFQASRYSRLS
jgi:hypothetical protein